MTDETFAPAPADSEAVEQPTEQTGETDAPKAPPEGAKAEEKPRRAPTAREALEKAFAGGSETKPTPEEKAAAEANAAEKADPKSADKPKEPTKDEAKGAQRGPDGKFAPKEGEKAAEKPGEAPQDAKATEKPAKYAEAPARLSADAKAAWEQAPEPVKAEVHRAFRELEQGLGKYQERTKPLEPYFEMAQQSGRQLHEVVKDFVDMENILRQNPARGFGEIARRMGFTPQQVGEALLGQQPGQADPRDQEIMTLRQELSEVKQQVSQHGQTFQQQQQQTVMQQIEQFAGQHPRFDELAGEIARMIDTGYASDLEDAYTKAERLNPAPQPAPQPAPPAPPVQTREARSPTGAPNPGSDPATKRTPPKSAREALSRHLLG